MGKRLDVTGSADQTTVGIAVRTGRLGSTTLMPRTTTSTIPRMASAKQALVSDMSPLTCCGIRPDVIPITALLRIT
jgi:hypothetical protein